MCPNGTRKLYQITHDYLVQTKGLTNLIWIWDLQDLPNLSQDLSDYNPGDSYWDIDALDVYRLHGENFTKDKYNAMINVAGSKPITIDEHGILSPQTSWARNPTEPSLWRGLSGCSRVTKRTSRIRTQQVWDLYNAANVVTRDQMLNAGVGLTKLRRGAASGKRNGSSRKLRV